MLTPSNESTSRRTWLPFPERCKCFIYSLLNWRDKFREMTRCVMFPPLFRLIGWFHLATDFLGHRAAGMKATPRRDVDGTGQVASKNDALAAFLNLGIRDRYR